MRVAENHWYPLLESREVGRRPLGAERLGRRFVFWRSSDGQLHAQQDRCPHLGAALSAGTIQDDALVCPFHGFRYDGSGKCRHIPAIGRDGRIPEGFAVPTFPVREAHGFVWLWWGDPGKATEALPFFPQLQSGWRHYTMIADWPVHFTRAVENQLDVAHLAFVHRTTIGAGGRSRVDGPYVEADRQRIRVWVTNRRDDGREERTPSELAAAAAAAEPSLDFLFPGIWLLNIGPRLKNFIAFVPINETSTRYYLRSYRPGGNALLHRPFDWLMSWANRFILNQDRRVVITQTPPDSADARDDRLLGMDRAIIQFRRLYAQLLEPRNAP
ncbi:MAG TPA: aromatic ring-hydroxylating dioxygenase subunit alpha [Steroidobacteraceae bacterium]|nr:aromatic ring-hydroxylating dioxygenase subunit alpha [Steroidobacteraceae bacterium]